MKIELELECLEEVKCCFTQVSMMPMLQPPMIDLLGINDVDSPAFQQILDGIFECPKECNTYLHKLLPYLAKPMGIPEINMQMYDKYKCNWECA